MGKLDQQAGRGPLVGVGVEGHIAARRPRIVHEREHRFGTAGVGLSVIEVGEVNRSVAHLANGQRLPERVEEAVAELVADVGVIEPSLACRRVGQVGQLFGARVGTRRVVQAARQPKGPFGHALTEHGPHIGHGHMVGRHVLPAQGADAERRVPDQHRHVHRHPAVEAAQVAGHGVPVQGDVGPRVQARVHLDLRREIFGPGKRRVRQPIYPDDLGRHSLANLRLVGGLVEQPQARNASEGR